jgi:hypothetical protein
MTILLKELHHVLVNPLSIESLKVKCLEYNF